MLRGVENNLLGAWHLLAGKQTALKHMDFSRNAMKQSWRAMLLALPFIVLGAYASKVTGPVAAEMAKLNGYATAPLPSTLLSVLIGIAVWIAGVAMQRAMAVLFGKPEKANAIVVINNWFRLLINFVGAPFALLTALHWLDPKAELMIIFCLAVYAVALQTWISAVVLDISWWRATAMTLAVMLAEFLAIELVAGMSFGVKLG